MPYRSYFSSSDELAIEVEGVDTSGDSYAQAFEEVVLGIAAQVAGVIDKLPKQSRPARLQVELGLKALSSGGFAITQSPDATNFQIQIVWNGSGDGSLSNLVPNPGAQRR